MPFPDWLEPMAATLTADRFTDPAWTFERKLDGIRVLAFKRGARVALWSRNRLSLTAAYPAVAQALALLPHDTLILDGEATGGWGRMYQVTSNSHDSVGLGPLLELVLRHASARLSHALSSPKRRVLAR